MTPDDDDAKGTAQSDAADADSLAATASLSTSNDAAGDADAGVRAGEADDADGPSGASRGNYASVVGGGDGLIEGWGGGSSSSSEPERPDQEDSGAISPPTTTVPGGIDYSNVDETPYEHNFEPGDHIIRWDMLPILWPIQIHGIVLEVSEDKSEVTICDFGITSVKNDGDDGGGKKLEASQGARIVEEKNAEFNEALRECSSSSSDDASKEEKVDDRPESKKMDGDMKKKKERQRLTVIKLTKWSDLRKWSKVNYDGGLLNAAKGGGVGKGLKKFGQKTEEWWSSVTKSETSEKLWSSMTKSFAREASSAQYDANKSWRSVRYDVNEEGYCMHHPDVQLQRLKDDGDIAVVRKKCPECIKEDCPAMMGEDIPKSKSNETAESAGSFSSKENEHQESQMDSNTAAASNAAPEESNESGGKTEESINGSDGTAAHSAEAINTNEPENDEPKTLEQMISDANNVEQKLRSEGVKVHSPGRRSKPKQNWGGSFVKSLSNIFPPKNQKGPSKEETETQSNAGDGSVEPSTDAGEKSDKLPKTDPPVLVLARTRFILEHGESVLPPYHIINSNSECIAVWCKTGRWGTLQASVFLHSTAIGHAKSATALTLGVAATQPWLIPAFATLGVAAVGTPWLFLKVGHDKWNEATLSLTDKFWAQAEPEVFVECIEKWGRMKQE